MKIWPYKKNGGVFFGGKPLLQIEASVVCLWGFMFSKMRPPYRFLLISSFLFFSSFFSFLGGGPTNQSLGTMRRRAFEFGQTPDQICAQEKISAWAYPHCRYIYIYIYTNYHIYIYIYIYTYQLINLRNGDPISI